MDMTGLGKIIFTFKSDLKLGFEYKKKDLCIN